MPRQKMEAPSAAPHRLAVVVLGMHRSGTSAMAGCLARFGARTPRTEIAPTVNNPKGYCESEPVMLFNDRLLAQMGSAWHDWRQLDHGHISAAMRRNLSSEVRDLLAREFDDAGFIVLKDPRLCRLMPLWGDFLDKAGYEARYVLPVRHPLQSALSLRLRNGFSLETGRLLWLRHVFEAERLTRGLRRHIVASEYLVEFPDAAMSAVAGRLDLPASEAGGAAVRDFVEPALFHRELPADRPMENRWISGLSDRVHAAFFTLDGNDRMEALDSLYIEFETVTAAVSKVFMPRPSALAGCTVS